MNTPYSTSKIVHHPDAVAALRRGVPQFPIFVQIFPTNLCNHACDFCSYGHWTPGVDNPSPTLWKNHKLFVERDHIPRDKMIETINVLAAGGCKAVEITGGGEPTTYPYWDDLVDSITASGMEMALVTNGVRLDAPRVKRLAAASLVWARVSIDAGSAEDYCTFRHVPESHWHRAWGAVSNLAANRHHPEARVGVGYVIDRYNWRHVYDGCRLAKHHGADNIRISLSFTPEGPQRWGHVLDSVSDSIARAKSDLEGDGFSIYNLTTERRLNVVLNCQEYPFCYWKEVACIIAADQCVYSCCSWAYNQAGLVGHIRDCTFADLWNSPLVQQRRQQHDPRHDCRIHCLYEARNKDALTIMMHRSFEEQMLQEPRPPHVNFV